MKWLFRWWQRRRDRQQDWSAEIQDHLEMRAEWHAERGLDPPTAAHAARKQFGSRLAALDGVRAVHISPWLDSLLLDLRYALRTFRRSPSLVVVSITTIALGIGASTAVFSVVDPLLFRHLPYPDDHRLVSVGFFAPVDNNEFNIVSAYLDWRSRQSAFQSITSMRPGSACDVAVGDSARRLSCFAVDANFLSTLGVSPVLGRDFTGDDDRFGAPTVVLLSHNFWQTAFGADPHVLHRTILIDDVRAEIIGVLPANFEMPQLGEIDVMMPQRLNTRLPRSANASSLLRTFARLRPGVSIAEARTRLMPLFQDALQQDVPRALRSEVRLVVRSLRDRQIQEVKASSWMLLGAVLALLLLACANVANLRLAGAAARSREMALRAAIGAGFGRLVRQSITESLLLGLAGGIAGCGVAWALLRLFVHLAPDAIVRMKQAHLDLRVLLFSLLASLASALLFGLAPALERPSAESLTGWRTTGHARTLFRKALVAGQIALSLLLLTGASLFLRSLWRLQSQPLGFQPEHVVTASFTLRNHRYAPAGAQSAFFNQLEARLRRLPGAGAFALSDSLPPRGSMGRPYSNMRVAGRPPLQANGGMVGFRWVSPGYFQTLGIPILSGRDFQEEERGGSESPLILSASLAHKIFGDVNPLGHRVELSADGHWSPIVGVVADAKNNGIVEPAGPEYYRLRMRTLASLPRDGIAIFRTRLAPDALILWIRQEFAALDPGLPVTVESLQTRVDRFGERPRFLANAVALFALLGLALAAIGLYGVLTFLVAQRTREIGIRMALGARPRDIAWQIEGQAALWTALGIAAGLAASLAFTRLLDGLLFEISTADPWSFTTAVAVLAAVAAIAACIPSWRAARVDPLIALRHE